MSMPDPADIRASDQDRERAVMEIREHFAAGRLSEDEMTKRIQAAYDAKTQSELDHLRKDLPKLPATKAETRAELAERRGQLQRRLIQQSGGALVPFVICTVIWLASGAGSFFWPVFVLIAVLIPLIRNGWRLYGPAPELDRVEHELAHREHCDEPRQQLRAQRSRRGSSARDRRRRGRY